jgi:hypothetical protein
MEQLPLAHTNPYPHACLHQTQLEAALLDLLYQTHGPYR